MRKKGRGGNGGWLEKREGVKEDVTWKHRNAGNRKLIGSVRGCPLR